MILRVRDGVDVPKILTGESPRRAAADQAALAHFSGPIAEQRRTTFAFDPEILGDPSVASALMRVFVGLCAICGIGANLEEPVVHRWRPPQGALNESGSVSRQHYFWLAFEWDNLYLLCQSCSQSQGAKFPVSGERSQRGDRGEALRAEGAELLDPCLDDAEQSLVYYADGGVVGLDRRAQVTADVFALNRAGLIQERRRVFAEAKELCRDLVRALDQQRSLSVLALLERGFATDVPFAAVTRQVVNQTVQSRRRQATDALASVGRTLDEFVGDLPRVTEPQRFELRPPLVEPRVVAQQQVAVVWPPSVQVSASERTRGLRTVNVSRVHIENFKGLEDVTLELASGVGRWTMLIGENGVGKTSILQAVAMSLTGRENVDDIGMKPKTFTRRGERHGRVIVDLDGTGGQCVMEFSRSGRMAFETPFPIAVAAYGSTRLPHTRSAQRTRYIAGSIQNLFDPHASLLSTQRWVPGLDRDRREAVVRSVHAALGLEEEDHLYFTEIGNLRWERDGIRLGIEDLSSGYQAVGALALDLARVFIDTWETLESAEGLVLLDEIEAHLHPRWQMQIVRSLRSAFPRVQFLATTHSPLCLRGLHSDEVRVLHESREGGIWIDSDLPPLHALSTDQLLTSEHFGLSTTFDDGTQQLYERYYRLLSTVDATENDRRDLAVIREEMERMHQYGATRRERMMLEVVDEFLADERQAANAADAIRLEGEARETLREIWSAVRA